MMQAWTEYPIEIYSVNRLITLQVKKKKKKHPLLLEISHHLT